MYVGLGSNIDPCRELALGLDLLAEAFGDLRVSPAYAGPAVGFDGPPFVNLVVGFDTHWRIEAVAGRLRRIEYLRGRRDPLPKFSSRALDLDLLLYGNHNAHGAGIEVPRRDIVEYAHVLWPLADIAGDEIHPQLQRSYRQLKRQLKHQLKRAPGLPHGLRRVSLPWRPPAPGMAMAAGR